jgi:CHAT domain-containing protein
MCPRPKSVGFALTQFSVGIATLLLCFAPLPQISLLTGVAQAQTIQQRQTEAERLLKQGNRQRRAREFTAALESYQQALKIYQEFINPQGQMKALRGLSRVYFDQKNYPQTIEYAQKQLELARAIQDYESEHEALLSLYEVYMEVANYAKAIEAAERMLALARAIQDYESEHEALSSLYEVYMEVANYAKAIEAAERMLALAPKLNRVEVKDIIEDLESLAQAYAASGNQAKVVDYYEQGLKLARENHEQEVEIRFLTGLGKVYHQQGDSAKAADYLKQSFKIVQELNDQEIESTFLSSLGDLAGIYLPKAEVERITHKVEAFRLLEQCNDQRIERQFASALQFCQQALEIYQELKDTPNQIEVLKDLGRVYRVQGKHPEVIKYTQKRLELARAIQDDESEEKALLSLYRAYMETANYAKAIETAEQRIEVVQKHDQDISEEVSDLERAYAELGDQTTVDEYRQKRYLERLKEYQQELGRTRKKRDLESEIEVLEDLGALHLHYKVFAKAVDSYEQGLKLARENPEQKKELKFLKALGKAYAQQGDSVKAADYLQQLLKIEIEQGSNNPLQESEVLQDLGDIYLPDFDEYTEGDFADYTKGIEYYEQALALVQKYCKKNCDLGDIFERLGDGYKASGNPTKALENYQKLLTFFEQEGEDDPEDKANLLKRLADTYIALGDYTKAIESSQQQLAIIGRWDYSLQKSAFRNLGLAYQRAGNPVKALESYQMELALSQERNDRNNQVSVLNSVASLLVEQNKPELAIVFYKQSVNVIETTRQELQQLPKRTQEAYTRKVEGTYRRLADCYFARTCTRSAASLELLKIQEIRNYTRNASAGEQTSRVGTNPTETQVVKTHGTLIAFGEKVAECEQSKCTQLSQLLDQREVLSTEFNRAVNTLEQSVRKNRGTDLAFTDPTQLFGNPDQIVSAQPGTILLQTLVLPDKLWVLWASKGGVTKSIPVSVGQKQLSETVLKFRELLQNPNSNIQELQATGKQLYDWLIPTQLQAELTTNSIQHLVFLLDHVTRYIPMAALFDGKQYLTQRYTLSTIISTNTQMGNSQVLGVQNTSVLALGLSEAKAGFNPLPNVPTELDAIVRRPSSDAQGIYQGSEYLNSAFTWRTLRDNLSQYQILHIATHGKFEPGSADASFLVMGDGEKLPIPKIETLKNLGNLQLVALSACETALGGTGQDGTEIAGISFYFLNKGAKAVMASLWAVNDGSTSLLMQQFYKNLSTDKQPSTKAEALRQAQLSLLTKQVSAQDAPQRSDAEVILDPKPDAQLPRSRTPDFSHPYYWAPFILIGNSL